MIKTINHPDRVFETLEEAIEGLPAAEPRAIVVPTHEILMTGEGLKVGETDVFPLATSGLKAMFKRLKIPFKFGTEILPTEDAVRDVNSLLTVAESNVMLMVRPDDNSVVGFTNDEFTPVPYRDLLQIIVPPEGAEVEKIRANDENMVVNIVKDRDIEPVEGDISKVGNRIVTSNTGFSDLHINTFLFRLVCSNGATVSKEFGGASFNLRGRSSRDILTDSMVFINQAAIDVEHIAAGLEKMVTLPIGEMSMYNIEATYITKKPALQVLPSKVRGIIRNREQSEQVFQNVTPETPAYDVYNNITQAAHRFELARRTALEEVGGSVLSVAMSDVRKAA